MNKRIEELAGKALDKAVPYTWHNLDHVEIEKVMKEFAELIVKECAEIAKKEQAFNEQYTAAKKHPQVNIDQCILMGFGL